MELPEANIYIYVYIYILYGNNLTTDTHMYAFIHIYTYNVLYGCSENRYGSGPL